MPFIVDTPATPVRFASSVGAQRSQIPSSPSACVSNLVSLQLTNRDVGGIRDERRAVGAFRDHAGAQTLRLGNTQHIIDAYRKIQQLW